MPLLYQAHCNHRAHLATVERVDRDGHHLAHREEAARLRQAEQVDARPIRRSRGVSLLHGLRRLRLA